MSVSVMVCNVGKLFNSLVLSLNEEKLDERKMKK